MSNLIQRQTVQKPTNQYENKVTEEQNPIQEDKKERKTTSEKKYADITTSVRISRETHMQLKAIKVIGGYTNIDEILTEMIRKKTSDYSSSEINLFKNISKPKSK